jgi:hypothetical protein
MPAGATYEPIVTVSPTSSPFEFTSIPATYTDLRVVVSVLTSVAGSGITMQINNDTGTNYSQTDLNGDSTSATSNRASNEDRWYLTGVTANTTSTTIPLLQVIDIFSYAGSTNKTGLITHSGDKNGSGRVARRVALWRSTSAITSLKFFITNVTTGTTATLYGIKAA